MVAYYGVHFCQTEVKLKRITYIDIYLFPRYAVCQVFGSVILIHFIFPSIVNISFAFLFVFFQNSSIMKINYELLANPLKS